MRLLRGTAFGAAAALLALGAGLTPLGRTAELKLYDWRVRATAVGEAGGLPGREAPAAADQSIALIQIDDDSLKRMAPLAVAAARARDPHRLSG